MDTSHIISGSELRRLHRSRRWWAVGWCLAVVSAVVTAWSLGRASAYDRALVDVRAIHALQVEDRVAQVDATKKQIQMWEQINSLNAVVTQWGKPIQDMIDLNHTMETQQASHLDLHRPKQ